MSDKLALSSALSVLMMASYVLFGSNTLQVAIGPDALISQNAAQNALMPHVRSLIEGLR